MGSDDMEKEIIPTRLLFEIKGGKVSGAFLHYQRKIDGALDTRKMYSMSVSSVLAQNVLDEILGESKKHAEKGEGVKKNGLG